MILSMTGYGKSEKKNRNFNLNVEIKSLNNRFFDPVPKIHPLLKIFEKEIILLVKNECIRGRIFINVDIDINNNIKQFSLNKSKLTSYLSIINQISNEANIKESVSLDSLLKYQDIIENIGLTENDQNKKIVINAVKSAIKDFKNFRKNEGDNLLLDINILLKNINNIFTKIENIAKKNKSLYAKSI